MKIETNEKLWNSFINKIKAEWDEKYYEFGSFDNIKNQTNFSKAVEKDIREKLKTNHTTITWNTLNIYFNQNSFGKKPKNKTLDIFYKYVGIENILEDSITERKNYISRISETKHSFPKKKKRKLSILMMVISLVAFLTILSFYFYTKMPSPDERMEKERIINMLDRANALEFSLYSSVPDLKDTINLNKYYLPSSVNKKEILKILLKSQKKGNVLDIEKSTRMLNKQAISFDKLNKDEATVRTIEFWQLQWINSKTKERHAEYKVVNEQRYILKKKNNKWLIVENHYEGTATWF